MFASPSVALSLLEHYKYFLIFPIAVFEGPIIIVISGFLVFLGYLNPIITYVVVVIADVIGDSLYYTIGRYWRRWQWVKKYAKFVGYDEESETFLEHHFEHHKAKTFLLAKVSHGIGGAVQVAAGIAKVSFQDFLFYSFLGTMPKALILLLIGYYMGSSYVRIDNIFDYIAITVVTLVVITFLIYFILGKFAKKQLEKADVDN